jgi:catechol 2,3-dioxygenase-like lactoylglutathione lyase family enzyme
MHDLESIASLSFHHLGLAARVPERAAAFLRALGYEIGALVRDPLQKVDLALATHPAMPTVEIVAPLAEGGQLASLLSKDAEMVYHVCFETRDRASALAAMAKAGSRILPVSPATPAVLFGGRQVSFHRVSGFGLIELLDAEAA